MRRHAKATLALPLVILLSGAVIPLVVSGGGRVPAPPADAGEPQYAGRTANEWCRMAMKALDQGKHDLAIKFLRTAEKAQPGAQYSVQLAEARRERRRAGEVAGARARLLGGEPAHLEVDLNGTVVSAYRTTVVLPGESLWTLAEQLVAADRGIAAAELVHGERAVYAAWDVLTALNGVRELDVGEIIAVPLLEREADAISGANALDLETIGLAQRALDSGDLDGAISLRNRVNGDFAGQTDTLRALDEDLTHARASRLLDSAREILAGAEEMARPDRHGDLVRALREARGLLSEAEATAEVSVEPLMGRATAMLSEAEKYRVGPDGVIAATKPAGVAYADFARETVEWFMRRELAGSGKEYPHQAEKTRDEIAWAAYLLEASALADRDGVDFARLLTAASEEPVRLPNPADYFAGLVE